jgi:alkylhydroperoxidase/carboxymuconolactone decarboxylase family protein YurZ
MTNDNNPAKGSSQKGLNRRQFVFDTGLLLGTVAVGEFAVGEGRAAEAEQGSDGKKLAPNQIGTKPATNRGPWDPTQEKLRQWDPKWAEACEKMTINPWIKGVLPRKTIELISVGLNAACTNLNPDGTRRHIRAALEAGATRDEVLMVLKMASLLSIHSCSLGAPILLEEAKAAGVRPVPRKTKEATPACDKMREIGQWNQAWDPFYELDPAWTDEFFGTAIGIYASNVLTPKDVELLSIALDASYTHMYAPGTRRHIKAALKLGATMEEIMEVLKLCVVQGVQACNLGVPILAEETARRLVKGNQLQKRTKP